MQNTSDLVSWYQNLSLNSLKNIENYYSQTAFFKDPFNEVNGLEKITSIFYEMFHQLERPRFIFIDTIEQGDQFFVTWYFIFLFKKKEYCIHGSSHLKLENNLIIYHRDYWDVGEELLLKIPVVKNIYSTFRKRISS